MDDSSTSELPPDSPSSVTSPGSVPINCSDFFSNTGAGSSCRALVRDELAGGDSSGNSLGCKGVDELEDGASPGAGMSSAVGTGSLEITAASMSVRTGSGIGVGSDALALRREDVCGAVEGTEDVVVVLNSTKGSGAGAGRASGVGNGVVVTFWEGGKKPESAGGGWVASSETGGSSASGERVVPVDTLDSTPGVEKGSWGMTGPEVVNRVTLTSGCWESLKRNSEVGSGVGEAGAVDFELESDVSGEKTLSTT
ncbi:hypothetical protein BSKO_10723 [Bryopsis sp. KO-2023]|nr:hypothetical protein BSKO_10723 [Bryopsis sp. KO-2023]